MFFKIVIKKPIDKFDAFSRQNGFISFLPKEPKLLFGTSIFTQLGN